MFISFHIVNKYLTKSAIVSLKNNHDYNCDIDFIQCSIKNRFISRLSFKTLAVLSLFQQQK